MDRDYKTEYDSLIAENPIFLFMMGTPDQPRCGFSYRVVRILDELGVEFTAYDVSQDPEMREAVKELANWPTYPQLYINGEFVGGCEIVEELFREGELQELLSN